MMIIKTSYASSTHYVVPMVISERLCCLWEDLRGAHVLQTGLQCTVESDQGVMETSRKTLGLGGLYSKGYLHNQTIPTAKCFQSDF